MARKRRRKGRTQGRSRADDRRLRPPWWTPDRLAHRVLAVALLVLPFVLLPGIADEFRLPKLVVAQVLLLVSVLLLCASPHLPRFWSASRGALIAIGPLCLALVASAVLSSHPVHGAWAVSSLSIGALGLVVWSSRGLSAQQVLRWLFVPGLLISVVLLLQYFDLWQPVGLERDSNGRFLLTGFVGNVGEAANALVLPALAALVGWVREWLGRRRPWLISTYTAGFVVVCSGIAVTATATALIALVVGVVVLLTMIGSRRAGVVSAVAVALVLLMTMVTPARERAMEKMKNVGHLDLERLTTGRTDGWKAALFMASQAPILGKGFGSFAAEYTPAKEALLAQGRSFYRGHVGYSTFANAHNEPLEVLAESGLVGAFALLWACLVIANSWRRRWRAARDAGEFDLSRAVGEASEAQSSPSSERLELGVLAAAASVIVLQSLTYFPFRTALLGLPAVLVIAAVLSPRDPESSRPLKRNDREGPTSLVSASRAQRLGLAVATLALLVLTTTFDVRRISSSAKLRLAERAANEMLSGGRIYPTVLRRLMVPLEAARTQNPADERVPIALGSYHLLMREPVEAEHWYRASLAVAPRPETLFNLGRALLEQGRREEALDYFVRSVKLDRLRSRALPGTVADEVRARIVSDREQASS